MISRDVRRAGFWGRAYCNIWPAQAPADEGGDPVNCPVQRNPYTRFELTAGPARLKYERSTDFEGGNSPNADDNNVDAVALRPREQVGFLFDEAAGSIKFWVSGNGDAAVWQELTDPAVIRVTQFTMALTSRDLPVPCADAGCQARGPQCGGPVTVLSRDLTFTIVAQAVHDASVRRSLTENVRLRNSLPVEQCP
jgi:hypothetical protein